MTRKARPTREAKPVRSIIPVSNSLGRTKRSLLSEFVASAMKEYGEEVIENRAFPEYRDGLKPVHRCIIFAMYQLRIDSNGAFKKSARVIGEVIGKFHPHGDTSAYDAMVGITGTKKQGKNEWSNRNCSTPLIEGQGNFGDFLDRAAAMRYTEARLSRFATWALVDPQYMDCVDYIPNYDGSEKMPLVLPSKLPGILLNGNSSIGVGVSASFPPFALEGVVTITRLAILGKKITPEVCLKHLVIDPPYGGICISMDEDILKVLGGKGSLKFQPSYAVDERKKTITFTSVCPGITSQGTLESFLDSLANVNGVSEVMDLSSKTREMVVYCKRGTSPAAFDMVVENCLKKATRTESYELGVTSKKANGRSTFSQPSIPKLMEDWAAWRIQLEDRLVAKLILKTEAAILKVNTMILAVLNIEIIAQALVVKADKAMVRVGKETVEVDAGVAYLVKKLKITIECAELIMEMKVRMLRNTEVSKLKVKLADLEKQLSKLEYDSKNLPKRIVSELPQVVGIEDNDRIAKKIVI